MALRRGFKADAKRSATELRGELGLTSTAPLEPLRLADHLDVPVLRLSDMKGEVPRAYSYFTGRGKSAFSALTVFDGPRRLVVFNDSHVDGRQASSICHELAHAILFHEPNPALNEWGCRVWDKDIEDEADWLSGAILVTEEAALFALRQSWDHTTAARAYGVSVTMMRYRTNVSGAATRFARANTRAAIRGKPA